MIFTSNSIADQTSYCSPMSGVFEIIPASAPCSCFWFVGWHFEGPKHWVARLYPTGCFNGFFGFFSRPFFRQFIRSAPLRWASPSTLSVISVGYLGKFYSTLISTPCSFLFFHAQRRKFLSPHRVGTFLFGICSQCSRLFSIRCLVYRLSTFKMFCVIASTNISLGVLPFSGVLPPCF